MKRVFIVGCPRSGTTLLQGILASHPEVFSLPETFFFAKALSRNVLKKYFLWPAIKVRKQLIFLIKDLGRDDLMPSAKIGLFQYDYHKPFVSLMDQIAIETDKSMWVEKTPMHLYCIDEIQRKIPDALIIHIIRNGLDVVTSLVETTNNNPVEWARLNRRRWKNWRGYSIADAIKRWNYDLSITRKYLHKPSNTIVRFEDLIVSPEATVKKLCGFLGIAFNENMMNPSKSHSIITRSDEPWKLNNARNIGERDSNKKLFSDIEKKMIIDKLDPYNII